jgi:acyl carrier protein
MTRAHRQRIERKVRELMITRLRISASRLEASDSATPLLGMGIGLDSMEAMSLALEIEEAFGIVVLDVDLSERLFASFNTLTDYIIKQGGRESA